MGVSNMGIYNKVYIGHVETINTNANVNENAVEHKVVALQLLGFDKNRIPKYRQLRNYVGYFKLMSVEPVSGIVTDKGIDRAIKKTGKEEVKVLKLGKRVA